MANIQTKITIVDNNIQGQTNKPIVWFKHHIGCTGLLNSFAAASMNAKRHCQVLELLPWLLHHNQPVIIWKIYPNLNRDMFFYNIIFSMCKTLCIYQTISTRSIIWFNQCRKQSPEICHDINNFCSSKIIVMYVFLCRRINCRHLEKWAITILLPAHWQYVWHIHDSFAYKQYDMLASYFFFHFYHNQIRYYIYIMSCKNTIESNMASVLQGNQKYEKKFNELRRSRKNWKQQETMK